MRTLGVVLAGGRSSRFGSDKAEAILHGQRLIDRAHAFLMTQCADAIIVGRGTVPDRPRPGLGPLGGLAGALAYAAQHGFDRVVSIGVDSVTLPHDLIHRLSPAPAFVETQPVIGLWPVAALTDLDALLAASTSHAVRAFAERIGARPVRLLVEPANINTPDDLVRLEHAHGL